MNSSIIIVTSSLSYLLYRILYKAKCFVGDTVGEIQASNLGPKPVLDDLKVRVGAKYSLSHSNRSGRHGKTNEAMEFYKKIAMQWSYCDTCRFADGRI